MMHGGSKGMKIKDAYEIILKEYLDKTNACDECVSEYYCIENGLKRSRTPQDDCNEKLKAYFRNLRYNWFKRGFNAEFNAEFNAGRGGDNYEGA